MTNPLVEYVTKIRAEYATLNNIFPPSSVSLGVLDLSQEVLEEYNQIVDEIVAETVTTFALDAQTGSAAHLTFESIENTVPPTGPNSSPTTYISTRFTYAFTYNCDSSNQIDLKKAWSSFIPTLPTHAITTYFTPTSDSLRVDDSGIEDSPTSITDGFTIDTENQPEEPEEKPQENSSFFIAPLSLSTIFLTYCAMFM